MSECNQEEIINAFTESLNAFYYLNTLDNIVYLFAIFGFLEVINYLFSSFYHSKFFKDFRKNLRKV